MVCQQTILMKYHALFVIFEKAAKLICRLLQIIGGALWVKLLISKADSLTFIWASAWEFQQCGMCDEQGSDQPAHMRSLIRAFARCLNILRVLSY